MFFWKKLLIGIFILNNRYYSYISFKKKIINIEKDKNISYHKKTMNKNISNIFDVAVIGNGPGGITASIYTSRGQKKTIMFTGPMWGGYLTTTSDVENYTGYVKIDGLKLIENMMEQALACGVIVNETVITKVIFSHDQKKPHILINSNGEEFKALSIIIATGATHKHLEIEKNEQFENKGIYYCATCDGTLFKYNPYPVIVVGGGNTALTEALYLSGIVKKVILIHRRDEFRGEPLLIEKIKRTKNIEILWDTEVDSLHGDEGEKRLISIDVINNKTKVKTNIQTNGVFIAIGFNPNSKIFKEEGLEITENGYIVTDPLTMKTNILRVYAVGDVTDQIYRQAIVAAGNGCKAGINVNTELNNIDIESNNID
jgi:thioredoxin reductase (NADPH)